MSKSGFFQSSGATATAQNTIQGSVDAAAASATAAASSETDAQTAQAASEAARDASQTAQGASETARDTTIGYRNTAETHKDAAATSAAAALVSQNAAASSATSSAADVVSTNADVVSTNADAASTASDRTAAASSASSASTSAATSTTKASESSTSAAASLVSQNAAATSAAAALVSQNAAASSQTATAADVVSTNADAASTASDRTASASSASSASTSAATATTKAAEASTSASNAASSLSSFNAVYSTGSSDPTSNLDSGDLFYNQSAGVLKVYTGSAWEQGVTAGSGFLPLTGGGLTGNLTTTGLIDGRDVAADGTKLDGIEASATADQTAAEIRTLVESASDSNVFTDADHSKLNAIEASADVTDTTNVVAALTAGTGITIAGNGTIASTASSDLVDDSSPQLGGNLDTNGNDINFGDNDKATFGSGSDLQVFHSGTHSWINENGTGNLYIQSSGAAVNITNGSTRNLAQFNTSAGTATLFYDNGTSSSAKLATTNIGADITGVLTADGFSISGGTTDYIAIVNNTTSSGNGLKITAGDNSGDFPLNVQSLDTTKRLTVNAVGDISFYSSDGLSQGLFWDADQQRLGLGVTAASQSLHVVGEGLFEKASADSVLSVSSTGGSGRSYQIRSQTSGDFYIYDNTGSAARVTIDSVGNVGIGGSPVQKLDVYGGNIAVSSADTYQTAVNIDNTDTGGRHWGLHSTGSNNVAGAFRIYDYDANQERLRIDNSGNLMLNSTTALYSSKFTVNGKAVVRDGVGDGALKVIGAGGSYGGGEVLQVGSEGTATFNAVKFRTDTDGTNTEVGSISCSTGGTTYNTTSDLRLKTDIAPIADATETLMSMNAVTHKWKADPDADAVVGFIAQEMQEIVPEAVSGSADSDEMMSMDYGRITPVLVAALQDAHKKIEQLEQRIADMEAK